MARGILVVTVQRPLFQYAMVDYFLRPSRQRAFFWALLLVLISCAVSFSGVFLGGHFVSRNAGYPQGTDVQEDLFRFDSVYYYAIARDGYSYNGDPNSSPNIVFAPLFPILLRTLSWIGIDLVTLGFALNHILLFFSFLFLFLFLEPLIGLNKTAFTLVTMGTAAGSYSLHAYYSECTMLFFLALSLLSFMRKWRVTLALAVAALGASRLAAAPIVGVFAIYFLGMAWASRERIRSFFENILGALICISGTVAYLLYIWNAFGNPFELLPQIQSASWGLFHPPISWITLISGGYFFNYWFAALQKGPATFLDIKTINLLWMTLGLISFVYLLLRFRRHILTFVFGSYFLFIYWSVASSDFLISSHRFFVLMIPLFMMFCDLQDWVERKTSRAVAISLSAVLILLNLAYGLLHTAFFNRGVWYYF